MKNHESRDPEEHYKCTRTGGGKRRKVKGKQGGLFDIVAKTKEEKDRKGRGGKIKGGISRVD